mmetsp:Transcript_29109/g.50903  ORF Transcript_29109/g.50903 Transcript_29109/m.50903 type:complete len:167 (+) Transcript_29109:51-551(+)
MAAVPRVSSVMLAPVRRWAHSAPRLLGGGDALAPSAKTMVARPTPVSLVAAASLPRSCVGVRAFCSVEPSVEERVMKAVKRYAAMRKEELKNATEDTAGNRDEMLKALEKDVAASTKWDDMLFDDLDKVEVLLEVEDEFSHIIPDDEADAIGSVKETVEYLQKNLT